jgi:hypothetical protein
MTIKTDIPVVIRPEAAARIEQLGIQREVEQMLEHTRQSVPGLESIEVEAWDDEFEPGQPHLSIVGWRPGCSSSGADFDPETEWGSWFVRAFQPEVVRWFSFYICYRNEHAR